MNQEFGSPTCVAVRVDGPVATLELGRPKQMNAFNRGLMEAIADAARWIDAQPQVKVAVIAGQGSSFSSGFDLQFFGATASACEVAENVDLGRRMIEAVSAMQTCTISAVQGNCIGGGVLLALACDFRYASADARFRLPETELGIPLAWGGIPRLMREVGSARTAELVLLCKEFGAEEAQRMGLVNDVLNGSTLRSFVNDVARTLAQRSDFVLKTTKRQLRIALEELASTSYGFMEAHVVESALMDDESVASRSEYLRSEDSP